MEKSNVDVFEEVVVEDIADWSDSVEEDVRARRRRARGIVMLKTQESRVCILVVLMERLLWYDCWL